MAIDLITYEFLKNYVATKTMGDNAIPRGTWNSDVKDYQIGDYVTHNNVVYVYAGTGNKNYEPGTVPEDGEENPWQEILSARLEEYASKEDLDKLAGLDVEKLEGEIDSVKEAAIAINNLPGQKTDNGGEIFNNYEENEAVGQYSHAEGWTTKAGQQGLKNITKVSNTNVITISNSYEEFGLLHTKLDMITNKVISVKLNPKVEYEKENKTNYNYIAIGIVEAAEIEGGATIKLTIKKNEKYLSTNYAEDWDNFILAQANEKSVLWFPELIDLGNFDMGDSAHAEGELGQASGYSAHKEGYGSKALGAYSHAEGQNTVAMHGAHAEGQGALASGTRSHAEGYYTKATNLTSHAEGYTTRATGEHSHVEGYQNIAFGNNSHAQGTLTISKGDNSHAEGEKTYAGGKNSHAEGLGLNTTNSITEPMWTDLKYNLPEKNNSKNYGAIGNYSHSEGNATYAQGENSHAENHETIASGKNSHAEGYKTTASGESSHAEGQSTIASGVRAHAEGQSTNAIGDQSHAEGNGTHAEGKYSHAEGANTHAIGNNSHTEGSATWANGSNGHAEGYGSIANGGTTHAEGHQTIANGYYSHTEGVQTKTGLMDSNNIPITPDKKGMGAHAEGWGTEAIGNNSHAEGYYTKTTRANQHVQGKYNFLSKNAEGDEDAGDYAHIVGNGTSDTNRKNIHTLDWKGNAWFAGDVTCTYNNTTYKMSDIIQALIDLGKLS